MSVCRGCGGTGIDANVPPRAAQAACEPVLMRKATGARVRGGSANAARIAISPTIERGRMQFSGPLALVIEHIDQRRRTGYSIVVGEIPDDKLACQWCNGYGNDDGQLTVRALEKLSATKLA